jgi:hypothetical protein
MLSMAGRSVPVGGVDDAVAVVSQRNRKRYAIVGTAQNGGLSVACRSRAWRLSHQRDRLRQHMADLVIAALKRGGGISAP